MSNHTNPETGRDFTSFAEASDYCTRNAGFLPVDRGAWTSPRYAITIKPAIGDPVSKGFNGDAYPCGVITKISASFRRVETSEGLAFYRKGDGEGWRNEKTWWLLSGHVSKRNPSF